MPPHLPLPRAPFACSRALPRRLHAPILSEGPSSWARRTYADEAEDRPRKELKKITLDDLFAPAEDAAPTPAPAEEPTPASMADVGQAAATAPRPKNRPMPPLRSLMIPFAERIALRAGDADPLKRRAGSPAPYTLIVQAGFQNTFLTLTHTPVSYLPGSYQGNEEYAKVYPMAGKVVAQTGAAHCGFTGARRKTHEGATQAAFAMFDKIRAILDPPRTASGAPDLLRLGPAQREGPPSELEIVFKGFGIGREAFHAALMSAQAGGIREMVRTYRDITPMKIGAPRKKKRRIV